MVGLLPTADRDPGVANHAVAVETLRMHRSIVVFLALLVSAADCDGGSFTPDEPDAGPGGGGGLTAADIGVPCTFDPQAPQNPSNQCRGGLECVFVPRSVRENALAGFAPNGNDNTLGMLLPVLEDHFTQYNDDGTDTGFCSLVGTINQIPLCPLGTVLKGFRSSFPGGIALTCMKPCSVSAECSAGLVCDARYFDDTGYGVQNGQLIIPPADGTVGFCVRPCEVDFPDCTRTGFAPFDSQGSVSSQVAAVDVTGGRLCNRGSGVCEARRGTGSGNDGASCNSSADCVALATCIQQDARGVRPADGIGYCATRCFVNNETGPNGTCGSDFCQPGLTYGYDVLPAFDPTGAFAAGLPSFDEGGPTRAINGLCFDRCVDGAPCADDGRVCDAVDAEAMQAPWNTISMCIPPEIALP